MQQASNPTVNIDQLLAADIDYDDIEVDDEDRKKILKEQGKTKRVIDRDGMEKLLIKCRGLYPRIKQDITTIDSTNTTNLLAKFEAILGSKGVFGSNNKIKNGGKKEDHADAILRLTNIFETVDVTLRERAGSTRRTRRANAEEEEAPTRALYRELFDLRRKVDAKARTNMANSANDSVLKGIKLPLALSGRGFNPSLVPADEKLRKCPFCKHESLNSVPEDEGYVARNDEKQRQYNEALAIWENYLKEKAAAEAAGRDLPPKPTNPYTKSKQPMGRAPTRLTNDNLEGPRLLCTCLHSQCSQKGSDVDSTCPCLCRKRPKGDTRPLAVLLEDTTLNLERYEWDGSPIGQCKCPLCMCPCNKLFFVADMAKIMLKLRKNQMLGMKQASQPSRHQQLGNFLATSIAAATTEAQNLARARQAAGETVDDEVLQNQFMDSAAQQIVQNGPAALGLEGAAYLQRQFGRSTHVELPEGQPFDTHNVTSNRSAHLKNNRIDTQRGAGGEYDCDYCDMSVI